MIQSGGTLGAFSGKFARPLIILLVKNVPAPLATMAPASAIDGAIQKNAWIKCSKSRKRNLSVISNEDLDKVTIIIKSLENLSLLIDRVSKTVKQQNKKQ